VEGRQQGIAAEGLQQVAGALVVEDDPVGLVDHHDADGQVFEGVGDEAAHVPLVLGHPAHDADARSSPSAAACLVAGPARGVPSRSRAISSASR
jgi:hypothetical protein